MAGTKVHAAFSIASLLRLSNLLGSVIRALSVGWTLAPPPKLDSKLLWASAAETPGHSLAARRSLRAAGHLIRPRTLSGVISSSSLTLLTLLIWRVQLSWPWT